MTDIKDLIERLEAAEGADRELDCDLHWAFDRARAEQAYWKGALGMPKPLPENFKPSGLGRTSIKVCMSPLTASLDAAVAFAERVFPNVMWRVGFDPDNGLMKGELVTQAPACLTGRGWSPYAPIALLIATLRAMEGGRDGC